MIAVIRIRGRVGVRRDIQDTLKMLRLHRKHHCVLFKLNDSIKGMLQKAKDYITWGEISEETLKKLIEKRGRKIGDKRLSKEEVEKVLQELKKSEEQPAKVLIRLGLKPVFRLAPPSKGFKKSIKEHYPKGELGYRGSAINELLERMI
ncbi:MAG TPA: 50S ribosomal protein L30 [Nanoarchaeota archaeon]|nr:50S ribosomal protein L30 [Nanoarchaeota archaeon]